MIPSDSFKNDSIVRQIIKKKLIKIKIILKIMSYNMNFTEIFLHLGIGKTGTKFLQYDFFPFLKNTIYIHRWRIEKTIGFLKSIQNVGKKILYSGEYDIELDKIITLLSKELPHAGIILVFRRQDEWILSQYKRFVKNGYHISFQDFFNLKDGFYYKPKDLFFYPKIEKIINYMKKGAIFLNYESLRKRPKDFLKKISDYIGTDWFNMIRYKERHKSYSEKQLKFSYVASRFIKYTPSDNTLRRILFILPIRYSLLYIGKFMPEIPYNILPTEKELLEIRNYYRDDWEKCLSVFSI